VASRVLLQYASLARGEAALSERLAQDLLFFCAQARPHEAAPPPLWPPCAAPGPCRGTSRWTTSRRCSAVRPGGAGAGAQARRAAKENWSALAGGDLARLKPSVDQLGLVVESLQRLHPGSRRWRRR
jgi:chemosensory pili system protein ChpA (sensor histidine kinase/response regulator)